LASEEFYKLDFLPTLRLKATYGYNGNIDKTVTAYTTANFTRNNQNGLPAANINNPPNPNLRWEKTGILNLGIEFGSKNGRLNGNLEYYSKKGIDLIGQSPLDPTSGQSSFRGNVANMKGSGVDLELHSINLDRKLRWESNLLFSYSRDEVTSYAISPTFASYMADASLTGSQSSFSPTPGKPLFGIYSKQWAGLDPATGNPMGYVQGVPSMNYSLLNSSSGQTVDSLVFHGRALPPVYGALRNSFSMKGFTISANITYRFGYYFKRRSIEYSNLFTTGRSHSDYALRWQKAGDEAFTSVPAFPADNNSARDNFYRNAEILVEKGDNIRLQDINLSYDLTNKQWTKLPFEKLSLFIYLNNGGLLWTANKQGIDPDYPDMKLSRSIAFGLRASL
ncbi:MAG TPA: TonB-dependent receptor, partial [Daejeonella sp.]|nr:TonB-dependent receptor [Daejeonella sp.]